MAITDRSDSRIGTPGAGPIPLLPVELDLATVDDVRAEIAEALRRGAGPVVLDCARLTFIDASGLGTLIWAANAAARAGRVVRLVDPGPALRSLLLLTGVRRRFELVARRRGGPSAPGPQPAV